MEIVERLAADTNAVVDLLRSDRVDPAPLHSARQVLLPLPVAGELFAGVHYSDRQDENLAQVEQLVAMWGVLHPDLHTARIYGRLRGTTRLTTSRINDLWIAALCIQHELPLLTKDRGFHEVPGLDVISW